MSDTSVLAQDTAWQQVSHSHTSVGRMAGKEELLLVALLAKKKSKRRSVERKVHVHPILSSRMNTGVHHTLFNDLCADEKKFFNFIFKPYLNKISSPLIVIFLLP